ncbi:MAG: peptidylprolyl isomerase, partial [Candidatus Sumerlaeota bacterium]
KGDATLEIKGEDIMAFPAYRFLWGDIVAREKMHIFPEDITYYFKQNPALYSKPETIVVRRLRVPTPSPLTIEVRTAALARAQDLRARAVRGGGLAPLLMEDSSLLVDPPGATVSFTRDVPGIDPQLIDEAFSLAVSQISRPVQTPSGFVLIEVMEHTIAEPFDREKVTAQIKTDLEKLQLGQQYDYQMLKEYVEAYPVDRARLYEFLSDDTDLLNVGNFTLTVGEFNKLYPDLIGPPELRNVLAVAGQTFEVITGEVARRDLAKRGLMSDPYIQKSQELAKKIFRTTQYGRIRRAAIEPTNKDLKEFIASKPTELEPGSLKTVWALRIFPRQGGNFNQQQIDTMQILMQNYMLTSIREASTKLAEARKNLAVDEELNPDIALRALTQPSDPRVRMRVEESGQFSKFDSQAVLGIKYESLSMDEFTQPLPLRDGTVVSYIVASEKPLGKLPKEQLEAAARSLYINNTAFKDEFALVKQWKKDGSLVYASPLVAREELNETKPADAAATDTLKLVRPEPAVMQ